MRKRNHRKGKKVFNALTKAESISDVARVVSGVIKKAPPKIVNNDQISSTLESVAEKFDSDPVLIEAAKTFASSWLKFGSLMKNKFANDEDKNIQLLISDPAKLVLPPNHYSKFKQVFESFDSKSKLTSLLKTLKIKKRTGMSETEVGEMIEELGDVMFDKETTKQNKPLTKAQPIVATLK